MDDGQVEDHKMRVAGLGTGLRIVLGAKVEAMEQLGFMDFLKIYLINLKQ